MTSTAGGSGQERSRVTAARLSYGAIALVVLTSLVIQLVLVFSGGGDANSADDATTVTAAERVWRFFSYFTVDSNIVVLIVSVLLAIDPLRRGRWWDAARLNALLAITITGLVFAIVLAPQLNPTGWAAVANLGLHYIAPWAFVAAWLIFGPRHRFSWREAVTAFVLPILWLIYIFSQGAVTDWYPYPFLEVTSLGYLRAVGNALLVLLLAAALAALFRLLDAKLPAALADRG